MPFVCLGSAAVPCGFSLTRHEIVSWRLQMYLVPWYASCCHLVRQMAEGMHDVGGVSGGFVSELTLPDVKHSTVLHSTLLLHVMTQSQVEVLKQSQVEVMKQSQVGVPLVLPGCTGMVVLTATLVALFQCYCYTLLIRGASPAIAVWTGCRLVLLGVKLSQEQRS